MVLKISKKKTEISRYSQNTASNNDTSSLLPQYATLTTCNSNVNESQIIRGCEEMEKLLNIQSSQKEADCILCKTSAHVGTFIVCSICSKNVHYKYNKPIVSVYYKKHL